MSGENDAAMREPSNPISNGFNAVVNWGMDQLGYNTRRRAPGEDNPFYRDNAQYMPGWSMPGSGLPSGAYAQDRATNYVGHEFDQNGNRLLSHEDAQIWNNVRTSLVDQEGARIAERQANGESGQLSFWDLYSAHENAYDNSGGHNSFVDPASFALAVYGAPMLEAVGINSGPITGASIDLFNDPTDSATEGWAKRMGLSAGEIGAGLMAMPLNPLVGAGMIGLGAFSGVYNTATAISHGMLGEMGGAIADGAGALWNGAGNAISGAGTAISNGASAVWNGAGNAISGAGDAISGAWNSLWGD